MWLFDKFLLSTQPNGLWVYSGGKTDKVLVFMEFKILWRGRKNKLVNRKVKYNFDPWQVFGRN